MRPIQLWISAARRCAREDLFALGLFIFASVVWLFVTCSIVYAFITLFATTFLVGVTIAAILVGLFLLGRWIWLTRDEE